MDKYWIYYEKFLPTMINSVKEHPLWNILQENKWVPPEEQSVYKILLQELQHYLKQGIVKLFGEEFLERRLTCYFSTENATMSYSGRSLQPTPPPQSSFIQSLLQLVNNNSFREECISVHPELKDVMPKFNAVFINHYRPPSQTDKPDNIGIHSDDEKSIASPVILSVTFCESGGERVFKFHEKGKSSKTIASFEIPNGAVIWMLAGCQQKYKHSVSDRKKNLNKQLITGGRINLTFRSIVVDK